MIRALYRTRLGRHLELALDIAEDLLRGYLGVDDLARRVRALEAKAERMEREDEERSVKRASTPLPFRDLLLSIARSARPVVGTSPTRRPSNTAPGG